MCIRDRYFHYRDHLAKESEVRTAAVDIVTDEENLDPDSEFADMTLAELAEESSLDLEEFKEGLESEMEAFDSDTESKKD